MRLKRIIFKAGKRKDAPPLDLTLGNLTILVGPNDSGKSQTLREIHADYDIDKVHVKKVLQKVEIDLPTTEEEVTKLLEPFSPRFIEEGEKRFRITMPNLYSPHNPFTLEYRPNEPSDEFVSKDMDRLSKRRFSKLFCVMLDGKGRLNLPDEKERGDLYDPQHYLARLYRNDIDRKKLKEIILEEFELHLYLDAIGKNMCIRLSKEDFKNERSSDEEAIKFMQRTPQIEEYGDGIKAFVGLMMGVITLQNKAILVDEPEAFLHPPAARALGKHLTNIAKGRDASLVIATHSSDFLMGCLESSREVTIVRLTYDRKNGTARHLDANEVNANIMNKPLLRSSNTMDALFHRATIICEGDADRAFYSEINYRLRNINKGIRDALFLNSQGKDSVHKIAGPLRKIGIPAVCIYDFDILDESGEHKGLFCRALTEIGLTDSIVQEFETKRREVQDAIDKVVRPTGSPDPWKNSGIASLKEDEQSKTSAFLKILADFGIYVVPNGEVEVWLRSLGIPITDKTKWVTGMLETLGERNIQAGIDDVWEFIDSIEKWVSNADRLGIP